MADQNKNKESFFDDYREKYFRSESDSDDSDASFHSLTQDLENCSVEDSLLRNCSNNTGNVSPRSTNVTDSCAMDQSAEQTITSNIYSDCHSELNGEKLSTLNLTGNGEQLCSGLPLIQDEPCQVSSDTPLIQDEPFQVSSDSPLIHEEDPVNHSKATLLNENTNIDQINQPDESSLDGMEEFDICCLDSVKHKDEEWELLVKDRDTDLPEEEIISTTQSAVAEKRSGNVLFTDRLFSDAISRYNAGLQLCPLSAAQDRAMLYHNRAVAYTKLDEKKLAVHSLSRALEHDPRYLKAATRRAGLHEELQDLDDALQDYKTVLELEPGNKLARVAVMRLPPLIEEKNEKLKAEMMGKLKDLGNMFLKPFGLSTNNFEMQQDPDSGGYNIKFNQNTN